MTKVKAGIRMTTEERMRELAAEITNVSGIRCSLLGVGILIDLSEITVSLLPTGRWKEPLKVGVQIWGSRNFTYDAICHYTPCTKEDLLHLFSLKPKKELEAEISAYLNLETSRHIRFSALQIEEGEQSSHHKLVTPHGIRCCMYGNDNYVYVCDPRRDLPNRYRAGHVRRVSDADRIPILLADHLAKHNVKGGTEIEMYHQPMLISGQWAYMALNLEVYQNDSVVYILPDFLHVYDSKPFDSPFCVHTYRDLMPNLEAASGRLTPEEIDSAIQSVLTIHMVCGLEGEK